MSLDFTDFHLEQVIPKNGNWSAFLDLSVDYIYENWEVTEQKEMFRLKYNDSLLKKFSEGNRFLYLLKSNVNCAYIGLVNAYLENNGMSHKQTLYIAEFSITKPFRGQGIGEHLLIIFLTALKDVNIEVIAAEVDKDKVISNLFWEKMLVNFIPSGERNLYYANIETIINRQK